MTTTRTLKQIAYDLRLDSDWLREQTEAGRIPAVNANGKVLYNREAVEAAIAKLAATSTATAIETK